MIIIYEQQRWFKEETANRMISDLVKGCGAIGTTTSSRLTGRDQPSPKLDTVGMSVNPLPALIRWESGQGDICQVRRLVTNLFRRYLIIYYLSSNFWPPVANVNVVQEVSLRS